MWLGSTAERPLSYEAANVIAKMYNISHLPKEEILREDLLRGAEFLYRGEGIRRYTGQLQEIGAMLNRDWV